MVPDKSDLPQGTLDLLILQVVAAGAIHGYAIAQRLQLISRDVVQVPQGSLYPALHRLENRGLLTADWKTSDTGRESKFYRLTPKGRKGAAPEQFDGLYVSADTFSVLRVKPALGRDFSAADDRPGAEAVAIISSNIWKSRYAASRDVLGRKVSVNGAMPATIVGVMPDGIRFIGFTDIWLPPAQMPGLAAQRRDTRPLMMIGRLPDAADLDRVRAELTPIAATLAVAHPDTNKDIRPLVNTLLEACNGGASLTNSAVYIPLLAAAFVLLIAAANLANLLLARAAYRSRRSSFCITFEFAAPSPREWT